MAIAGWSYGGYLSYLAVTRDSEFHFQAAMAGAGLSDWDLGIMTSDEIVFGTQIAGHAPWAVDSSNTHNRKGSAIWHMQDIKTPLLILHGENDVRVPVIHSNAFH
jgi:dipeptidyl aminopeptidase/acylaminoacyl peptidase